MTGPEDFAPRAEARTADVAVIRRAAFEITAVEVRLVPAPETTCAVPFSR